MASINMDDVRIYLSDLAAVNYYVAAQNVDGTYTVSTTTTQTPIKNLPRGWQNIEITWKRHPQYLGLFRSMTQQFTLVKDARNIILQLFYASGGGIQAQCLMRIDVFVDVNTGYQTAYKSEIDFSNIDDLKYNDNVAFPGSGLSVNSNKEGELNVSTLDSRLYELLQAWGGTQFNIPIWVNNGTVSSPNWSKNTGVEYVYHPGIKLLYQANFTSAANNTPDLNGNFPNMLYYTVGTVPPYGQGNQQINGWNNGARGSGYHTIPAMTQYNIVQNNGTTTFIGNDILQPFLLQANQTPGANSYVNEVSFSGTNNSQPYTRSNYSMKNLLQITQNGSAPYVTLQGIVTLTFGDGINAVAFNPSITVAGGGTGRYVAIVLFEIDDTDTPTMSTTDPTRYATPQILLKIPIPDSVPAGGSYILPSNTFTNNGTYGNPATITLNYNKVYVVGIIYDNAAGIGSGGYASFIVSNLEVSLQSNFDSGVSGVPIPAPILNPSVFPAISLKSALQYLIPYLNTTQTDNWGFPIAVPGTPYVGQSNFLSSVTAVADLIPANVMITSSYCIHDLQGQSYITLSLNQLFNFCYKVLGCGAAILSDGVTFQIERLSHYFDSGTPIIDLKTNVVLKSTKPFNDLAGCNIKLGYTKADTNSDFGVEPFNTEQFFNTPLTKTPQTIDLQETDFVTEQYAIEKIRAQQVSQPIGTGYDPANPSSDNELVAFYVGSQAISTSLQVYKPDNTPDSGSIYPIVQRNGNIPGYPVCAQSIDPTAASAPYIFGMRYPDTAINVELSPARFLLRDTGALLRSILDLQDSGFLTFRNTAVIQYNNTVLDLTSIQSNLEVGAGAQPINEFRDVPISNLPAKLFRPFIFVIETVTPVNFYSIMQSNPNGYVQFTWKGQVFKGFIWQIVQSITSKPTELQLICHPSITDYQLINA